MLKTVKRIGSAAKALQETASLQTLIDAARKERDELNAAMAQSGSHVKEVAAVAAAVKQANARANGAAQKLDRLSTRLSEVEFNKKSVDTLDQRVASLASSVGEAEQSVSSMLAPEGDLARHRQALQQLTAQNIEATARVGAPEEGTRCAWQGSRRASDRTDRDEGGNK